MKSKFVAILSLLFASAGLALGQPAGKPEEVPSPVLGANEWRSATSEAEPCRRLSVSADYLYWWIKGTPAPPLVTTGSAPDVDFGALGQPNTRVLFGGEREEFDARSGLRLSAALTLDSDTGLGIEGNFFFLQRAGNQASFNSDANGEPFIGRPFFDVISGLQNDYFTAVSAGLNGTALVGGVNVSTDTRIHGYEMNVTRGLSRGENLSISGLVGFRALVMKDSLTITENVRDDAGGTLFLLGTAAPPGTTQTFLDSFETRNRFYGGQVGVKVDWKGERFTAGLTGKLALGTTQEVGFIGGQTAQFAPGVAPQAVAGGILAISSNSGRHTSSDFTFVPEIGLNVGYDVSSWLNVRLGYSFTYWSRVARAGDLIDTSINTNLVPSDFGFGTPGGEVRPLPTFHKSDFWMQGVNAGVEIKF